MSTRDFLEENNYDRHESFSFDTIGKTVKGEIVERPRLVQVDFGKGSQTRLVLAVNTGSQTYAVWIKPGAMAKTVAQAVQAAGRTEVEKGGRIILKYTGDGEKTKGFPPKLYQAKYEPPVGGVEDDEEPF